MPLRKIPIVTGEIYHIFNKSIDRKPVFSNDWELRRAQHTLNFYRFRSPAKKLSEFLVMATSERRKFETDMLEKNKKLIKIFAYVFMTNHYHLLIMQNVDRGIAKFISQFQNSYTRYFNSKRKRVGPIFLNQFRAVRIETDEQFIHVARYIHLNPYSSFLVKNLEDLKNYKWSSLPEYLSCEKVNVKLCDIKILNGYFSRKKEFEEFIFNQADYQRELESIKHLIME